MVLTRLRESMAYQLKNMPTIPMSNELVSRRLLIFGRSPFAVSGEVKNCYFASQVEQVIVKSITTIQLVKSFLT